MIKYLNDDGVRELSSLVNTDIQKVKNDISQVSDSVDDLSNSVVEIENKLLPSKYRYADIYVNMYNVRTFLHSDCGAYRTYDIFTYVDLVSGLAVREYKTYSSSNIYIYVYNLYNDKCIDVSSLYLSDFSPDRKYLLFTHGNYPGDLYFYTIENESIVKKYINLKSNTELSNISMSNLRFANPEYVFFVNTDRTPYKPYILRISDGAIYNVLTDVLKGGVTLYYAEITVVPCKDKNTMYIVVHQKSSQYSFFMIKNLLQPNQEIVEFTYTDNLSYILSLSHFDVIDEDVIYSSSPTKIFTLNRVELTIDVKNLDNVDSTYSIDKYFGCLKNQSKWTFYRYDRSKDALVPYKKIEPLHPDINPYRWGYGCISLCSYVYGYSYDGSFSNDQFKSYSFTYAIDL